MYHLFKAVQLKPNFVSVSSLIFFFFYGWMMKICQAVYQQANNRPHNTVNL